MGRGVFKCQREKGHPLNCRFFREAGRRLHGDLGTHPLYLHQGGKRTFRASTLPSLFIRRLQALKGLAAAARGKQIQTRHRAQPRLGRPRHPIGLRIPFQRHRKVIRRLFPLGNMLSLDPEVRSNRVKFLKSKSMITRRRSRMGDFV